MPHIDGDVKQWIPHYLLDAAQKEGVEKAAAAMGEVAKGTQSAPIATPASFPVQQRNRRGDGASPSISHSPIVWASDKSSDTTCSCDRVKGLGGVCTHPPLALFRTASRRKMTTVRTLVRTSAKVC